MLENKIIFVAGACGRIGKALCKKILQNKGIAILADINENHLSLLKAELENEFKKELLSLKLDITSKESLNYAIDQAFEKYSKIDGFVNSSYPVGKDWGKIAYYEASYEQICESLNLHLGGIYLGFTRICEIF